jgi:hypothetical protein
MIKLVMAKRSRRRNRLSQSSNTPLRRGDLDPDLMETDEKEIEQRRMLLDNLGALLMQENSAKYSYVDYLAMNHWHNDIYDLLKKQRSPQQPFGDSRIDEYCREQIVEWSFRVVDYFRIDREVVAFSLSFLDRFLATCRTDRSSFKLAATTTLQLAVKLLYPLKLGDLGILSDLSRGEFDMKDVAEMEQHILKEIGWNLHPPTPIAFGTLLLDLLVLEQNLQMSASDLDDLYDISSFFSELAVCDYYFLSLQPSSTAIACILNALEGMFGFDNSWAAIVIENSKRLNFDLHLDMSSARLRLWELYERSEECAIHNAADLVEEEKDCTSSPTYNSKGYCHQVSTSPVTVAGTSYKSTTDTIYCSSRSKALSNGSW